MPYWVYVIRQEGSDNIKIGYTHNTTVRVMNLQTGSPQTLEVLVQLQCESMAAAQDIEARLHQKYAEYGVGGEWFNLPSDVLAELLWWFDAANRADLTSPHALRPFRDIPQGESDRESKIIFQQLFGGFTRDELREQQALYEFRLKRRTEDR